MPLMASSRHEVGSNSYPIALYILTPLLALGLQSLLALHFTFFGLVDLPLLVTIYYGLSKREPISATLAGSVIGIAHCQPMIQSRPIGVVHTVSGDIHP